MTDALTPEQVQSMIGSAEQTIATFITAIRSGQEIQLEGFEKSVQRIHHSVLNLPPEAAQDFREPIQRLINQLGKLSAELITARDAVKEEIQQINTKMKAQEAYKRMESSAPKED